MPGEEEALGRRAIQRVRRIIEALIVIEEEMEDAEKAVPEATSNEAQVEATADVVAIQPVAASLVKDVEVATEGPSQDVAAIRPVRLQAAGRLARLVPRKARTATAALEEEAMAFVDAMAAA